MGDVTILNNMPQLHPKEAHVCVGYDPLQAYIAIISPDGTVTKILMSPDEMRALTYEAGRVVVELGRAETKH